MALAVHSVAELPPLRDPPLTLRMTRGRSGAGGRCAARERGKGRSLAGIRRNPSRAGCVQRDRRPTVSCTPGPRDTAAAAARALGCGLQVPGAGLQVDSLLRRLEPETRNLKP